MLARAFSVGVTRRRTWCHLRESAVRIRGLCLSPAPVNSLGKAKLFSFTGDLVSAEEALRFGLVNK